MPNGVGYGEGCLFSSRLGSLGERRELPQRGPGQSPDRKRILAYFDGHIRSFLYLYDKNLRGTICISVPPTPNSGGLVPLVPPVIYAHAIDDAKKRYAWCIKSKKVCKSMIISNLCACWFQLLEALPPDLPPDLPEFYPWIMSGDSRARALPVTEFLKTPLPLNIKVSTRCRCRSTERSLRAGRRCLH